MNDIDAARLKTCWLKIAEMEQRLTKMRTELARQDLRHAREMKRLWLYALALSICMTVHAIVH